VALQCAWSGSAIPAQQAASSLGIDLSKCPTDITKPLSGTIHVGSTMALTGPVAPALLPVADGMRAAIADLNATSGLPVKFALTILDDQYLPSKASVNAQQLIQGNKVDFLNNPIGTSEVQVGSRGNTWLKEQGTADWVYSYDAWTVGI